MSGFLIYIPKWKHATMLSTAQMSERQKELTNPLVDGTSIAGGHSPFGPAGQGGIGAIKPSARFGGEQASSGYDDDKQTWLPCRDPQGGKDSPPVYWLGWWNDKPPKPKDLARETIQDGYPLRLGKDDFIIPAIHADYSMLDRSMHVDEFGEMEFSANPCYEDIVSEASYWHHVAYGDDEEKIEDPKRAAKFAVAVLQINYRVDARVCSMQGLGLFDSQSAIRTIVYVAVGGVAIDQELNAKKKGDTAGPGGVVSHGAVA